MFKSRTALLLASATAFFTLTSAHASNYQKLESAEIFQKAEKGQVQEIIVQFNEGSAFSEWNNNRTAIEAGRKRLSSTTMAERQAQVESDALTSQAAGIEKYGRDLRNVKASAFATINAYGGKVIHEFPHVSTALVSISDIQTLDALLALPEVKRVARDLPVKATGTWPSAYQDLTLINAPYAVSQNITGQGTGVAVMDTTVATDKIPNMPGNTANCQDTSAVQNANTCRFWTFGLNGGGIQTPVPTDWYPESLCGWEAANIQANCPNSLWQHGTLDAEIIARTAPGTRLLGVQVFNKDGVSKVSYVIKQLDFLVDYKQKELAGYWKPNGYNWPPLVALNMSITTDGGTKYTGTCPTTAGASEINSLLQLGVNVVVAAGNNGWTDGVSAPACVPGVIAVGAVSDSPVSASQYGNVCIEQATAADQVGCFSNRSPSLLTVYAPGQNLGSPAVYGGYQSGTSQAAPHVSAEVAILRSQAGGMAKTPAQIASLIANTGKLIADPTAPKNRIDIQAALKGTLTPPPPPPANAIVNLVVQQASPIMMTMGTPVAVVVTAYDGNGNQIPLPPLTWYSASFQYITVSSNGVLTGVSPGESWVTVSSATAGVEFLVHLDPAGKVTTPKPPNCKANPRLCA